MRISTLEPTTLPQQDDAGSTVVESANRLLRRETERSIARSGSWSTISVDDMNVAERDRAASSSPGLSVVRAQATQPQHQGFAGIRVSDLQIWTGYVTAVDDDVAQMRLMSDDPQQVELVGEFDVALVGDDPVEPGDVVYVTSRTVIGQTGYRQHTTTIRRQRIGRWTAEEMREVRQRAQDRAEAMRQITD